MRRALHEGHTPRPLQENAIRKSCPHCPQRAGKAVGQDAAFQIAAELSLHVKAPKGVKSCNIALLVVRLSLMSRPLRLELSGGLYHVTSRGDRREDIFLDDTDREAWLHTLGQCCERYNWAIHAWC
jgi:hypothetical protein